MIFQAGNVHESTSPFNLKEKKLMRNTDGFEPHGLDSLVYYANHYTTEDLLNMSEII